MYDEIEVVFVNIDKNCNKHINCWNQFKALPILNFIQESSAYIDKERTPESFISNFRVFFLVYLNLMRFRVNAEGKPDYSALLGLFNCFFRLKGRFPLKELLREFPCGRRRSKALGLYSGALPSSGGRGIL